MHCGTSRFHPGCRQSCPVCRPASSSDHPTSPGLRQVAVGLETACVLLCLVCQGALVQLRRTVPSEVHVHGIHLGVPE